MRTISVAGLNKPVSVIGLGAMIFHLNSQQRDFDLLDAFVECGGTYVDTAEVYGVTEEHGSSEIVTGEWLSARHGVREQIILSSQGLIPGFCAARNGSRPIRSRAHAHNLNG